MKKAASKKVSEKKEMRSEYDFCAMGVAERGKYYKAYRAGHKVEVHKALRTLTEIVPSKKRKPACPK